jgi:hypothetical protein
VSKEKIPYKNGHCDTMWTTIYCMYPNVFIEHMWDHKTIAKYNKIKFHAFHFLWSIFLLFGYVWISNVITSLCGDIVSFVVGVLMHCKWDVGYRTKVVYCRLNAVLESSSFFWSFNVLQGLKCPQTCPLHVFVLLQHFNNVLQCHQWLYQHFVST